MTSLRVEDVAAHPAFRRLASIAGVEHDLRYATRNNFDGRVLYDGIDCAWLRAEAAAGLEAAARWLASVHPGLRLVVLDALRPQRVQEAIWRDVAGTPAARYFAEPTRGSIHSFGMAVDATLRDAAGRELDMGSGFDEMTLASHPALEAEQLAAGAITREQVAARETLRAAMAAGGFVGIPTEWWHFDHGDRDRVRREFARVL
ncbi:MAG: M15 family metallopeptidase [Pseudomonadota bacterium]